jgi:hypothetical protein
MKAITRPVSRVIDITWDAAALAASMSGGV